MKGFQKLWICNFTLGLVCFLLFTIFSLVINTKGVSALRHDVNYIPLSSQASARATVGGDIRNPLFQLYWTKDYAPSFHSANLKAPYYYYTVSKDDYSSCEYRHGGEYGRGVRIDALSNGALTISHGFESYNYIYGLSENSLTFKELICRQNRLFGHVNPEPDSNIIYHPSLDESSLVNIPLLDRPLYKDLTRFYYDYDSIYLSDTAIDSSTGIHYSKSFSISQLYPEFIPTKFQRFVMPLGKANEKIGSIYEGRQIEFDMILNFNKTSSDQQTVFEWNPDLASNAFIRLYVLGEYEGSASIPESSNEYVDCSTTLIRAEIDEGYPSANLELTCNYIASHDFLDSHLWFYLRMDAGSSDYLFNTDVDWSFSGTKFITDNDSTPGATWGTEPTGEHLENAPGKATIDNSSDEDFFSSLKNMFTFNFVNPFATIFELFSDNNSCAQIPVIAGMIHSEESQVCPWFSSEVRNIVTPVLGIASMMLIFGFAVRWLGSSSGNMFEDSANETVSNVNHSGWRRYKK